MKRAIFVLVCAILMRGARTYAMERKGLGWGRKSSDEIGLSSSSGVVKVSADEFESFFPILNVGTFNPDALCQAITRTANDRDYLALVPSIYRIAIFAIERLRLDDDWCASMYNRYSTPEPLRGGVGEKSGGDLTRAESTSSVSDDGGQRAERLDSRMLMNAYKRYILSFLTRELGQVLLCLESGRVVTRGTVKHALDILKSSLEALPLESEFKERLCLDDDIKQQMLGLVAALEELFCLPMQLFDITAFHSIQRNGEDDYGDTPLEFVHITYRRCLQLYGRVSFDGSASLAEFLSKKLQLYARLHVFRRTDQAIAQPCPAESHAAP